jgi:hypothetical protein
MKIEINEPYIKSVLTEVIKQEKIADFAYFYGHNQDRINSGDKFVGLGFSQMLALFKIAGFNPTYNLIEFVGEGVDYITLVDHMACTAIEGLEATELESTKQIEMLKFNSVQAFVMDNPTSISAHINAILTHMPSALQASIEEDVSYLRTVFPKSFYELCTVITYCFQIGHNNYELPFLEAVKEGVSRTLRLLGRLNNLRAWEEVFSAGNELSIKYSSLENNNYISEMAKAKEEENDITSNRREPELVSSSNKQDGRAEQGLRDEAKGHDLGLNKGQPNVDEPISENKPVSSGDKGVFGELSRGTGDTAPRRVHSDTSRGISLRNFAEITGIGYTKVENEPIEEATAQEEIRDEGGLSNLGEPSSNKQDDREDAILQGRTQSEDNHIPIREDSNVRDQGGYPTSVSGETTPSVLATTVSEPNELQLEGIQGRATQDGTTNTELSTPKIHPSDNTDSTGKSGDSGDKRDNSDLEHDLSSTGETGNGDVPGPIQQSRGQETSPLYQGDDANATDESRDGKAAEPRRVPESAGGQPKEILVEDGDRSGEGYSSDRRDENTGEKGTHEPDKRKEPTPEPRGGTRDVIPNGSRTSIEPKKPAEMSVSFLGKRPNNYKYPNESLKEGLNKDFDYQREYRNLEAVKIISSLYREKRWASEEEQEILATMYTGMASVPRASGGDPLGAGVSFSTLVLKPVGLLYNAHHLDIDYHFYYMLSPYTFLLGFV